MSRKTILFDALTGRSRLGVVVQSQRSSTTILRTRDRVGMACGYGTQNKVRKRDRNREREREREDRERERERQREREREDRERERERERKRKRDKKVRLTDRQDMLINKRIVEHVDHTVIRKIS